MYKNNSSPEKLLRINKRNFEVNLMPIMERIDFQNWSISLGLQENIATFNAETAMVFSPSVS